MSGMTFRRSLTLALTLLAGAPWLAEAEQPIRIGASIGLTGSFAKPGAYAQQGYHLCQRRVNEQGGLLGGAVVSWTPLRGAYRHL